MRGFSWYFYKVRNREFTLSQLYKFTLSLSDIQVMGQLKDNEKESFAHL